MFLIHHSTSRDHVFEGLQYEMLWVEAPQSK